MATIVEFVNLGEPDHSEAMRQQVYKYLCPTDLEIRGIFYNQIAELLRKVVHAQEPGSCKRPAHQIMLAQSEHARRGTLKSSTMITSIVQTCDAELRQQAAFIWSQLVVILNSLNIKWYYELANDLKREMLIGRR